MTTKNQDIRIIGQGTYGCVYKPDIECKESMKHKTNSNMEYISKIQDNNNFSKREIEIGKMIKNIKYYDNYFAPIVSSCPINYDNIDKNLLKSCKPYNSDKRSKEGFISCKIRYVGKYSLGESLEKLLSNDRGIKQKMDQYIRQLADIHIYLLDSISKLNKNGILHMDLKENNIMFDVKKKLPIIIDYGLSYKTENLSIENYISKDNNQFGVVNSEWYNPWTIEVVLLSNISNMMRQISYSNDVKDQIIADDKLEILKKCCAEYIKTHDIFKIKLFSKEETDKYYNGLVELIDGFKKKKWIELWDKLISTYESWDNYSLTVIFVNELNLIDNNKKDMCLVPYMEVLKTILTSSISNRPNANDTQKAINILFKTINKRQYMDTIQELNNDRKKMRSSLMYETLREEDRIIKQLKNQNIIR